jgi:putative GTP pyrophosphokinase
MLQSQEDITVVEVKDYIQNPKPNRYRSLHLILQVPVFMSDRQEQVYVEVQIRTIAMDFWASLEHKIFYKYEGDVPKRLLDELTDAASSAMALDMKMEKLHKEIETIKLTDVTHNTTALEKLLPPLSQEVNIPQALLKLANSPNW